MRGRNGGSFVCEVPKDKLRSSTRCATSAVRFWPTWAKCTPPSSATAPTLASERSTRSDLDKLAEFIEVFAQAQTPETRAQADMRCLLTIAANAQSARLANMELAIQAEWASLVAMIYTHALHAQVLQHYRDLQAVSFNAHDSVLAADIANRMLQTLTDALIASKFSYDQNQ